MANFGKGVFGEGIEFTTEIVNGKCPSCDHFGIFISLEPSYYRCTSCGGDLEQKVNGIISYIPIGAPGCEIKLGRVSKEIQ
jgi:transposase-like protein